MFGCWQHHCTKLKITNNCKKNYPEKHRQWLQCSAWHGKRWLAAGGDIRSEGALGGRHCSTLPAGTVEC